MKYSQLPEFLEANGKKYYLEKYSMDSNRLFKGWWSCYYCIINKDNVEEILQAYDKNSLYFLCSCASTKKKAELDLLERLNSSIKFYTENKKKK